jgi:F-type H+-transporting ATPase subunit delta
MKLAANRYAQALYEVFPKEEQLVRAAHILLDSPQLWAALISPVVRSSEKEAVLGRLTELAGQKPLLRFFQMLARRQQMALLPEILDEFHDLVLKEQNEAEAVLAWARQPEPEELEKLRQSLCRMFHKSQVHFSLRLDPSLLGGFILNIEGVTYDQSIRGRLKGLARYLEDGAGHEGGVRP